MKTKFILTAITLIFVLMFSACSKKSETAAAISAESYAKILNGDFSVFAGMWANHYTQNQLFANGVFVNSSTRSIDGITTGDFNENNGAYFWSLYDGGHLGYEIGLFPAGVPLMLGQNLVVTDTAKVRILIYQFDGFPTNDDVFYREGELPPVTASDGAQTQIIDTEEGFDAGFDPSYFLDGDFWFTVGDTGLKVGRVNQATLNQLPNYVSFFDDISSEEIKIIFTSTNAIDLEYLAIRMDYDEAKNELSLDVVKSLASAIVRSDTPFVVNWEPQTEFPHRAVAFYDRNNIKRYFPISGNATSEGFRLHLNEWRASPQEAQ